MEDNLIQMIVNSIGFTNIISRLKNHNNYDDYEKLEELYTCFIKRYNELNRTFKLENPIEIYSMFNNLLYNGYLSKDKNFSFSVDEKRVDESLLGVNLLAGFGVCRHISGCLCDILNDYNIESSMLTLFEELQKLSIKIIEEQKYTRDELIKWTKEHIIDESSYKATIKLIDVLVGAYQLNIDMSLLPKKASLLEKNKGNHAITFAYKDGYNYYLDPTKICTYRVDENNKNILLNSKNSESKVFLRLNLSSTFNYEEADKRLKRRIKENNPCISLEDETKLIKETFEKYNDNLNIIGRFYNENSVLYEETSSILLRLKKKKLGE